MQRTSSSLLAAIATITALTLTAIAAPARAETNNDIARFIAGALTLYALDQAIKGNVTVTRESTVQTFPNPFDDRRGSYGRHGNFIPEICVFDIRDRQRTRQVVGRDCLKNTVHGRRDYPGQCKEEIRLRHNRKIAVYDMRCLRRYGYRVAQYRD